MKCLVVVAHPDDETIWMGGLILRHSTWDWRIVSLSRADDPERATRFQLAARRLGASALISDLDDTSPVLGRLSDDLSEIRERLSALAPPEVDLIFTHGAKGEYTRHERHEQTHRAAREMAADGSIRGQLLCFAYDDCDGKCVPRPSPGADIIVNLAPDEYSAKQSIVRDIYGFDPDSLEYRACGRVEAFTVHSGDVPIEQLRTLLEQANSEV